MSIITLTTCNNSIEANMLKAILANEGIESFLTNENFTTLAPMYNGMMGAGIQIMIDEKDFDQACKIVNQKSKTDAITCPYCNSENVVFGLGKKKLSKIALILLSFINATPFGNIRNTYYCKDCKAEFKI